LRGKHSEWQKCDQLSVAHTEKYRDSQGTNQEKTTWVDCAYWSDKTAISPYLTKGQLVFVEGAPEARSFQRNDGTPGSSLSLRVRDIQLLGGKRDSGNLATASAPATASVPSSSDVAEPVDDLPF
jgi:single-strand DNA-binding protein